MPENDLKPKGASLRSAVRWIAQNGPASRELIHEAARRHDLSPLDEDFLLRELSPLTSEKTASD